MYLKPTSQIKARLGIEPNGRVHKFFTQTCYKHMDKYVPLRYGDLRSNVHIESNKIVYQSPYAHYMYIGTMYKIPNTDKSAFWSADYGFWAPPNVKKEPTNRKLKYHTSGTGSFWDKRMISAEMREVVKEVEQYIGGKW